MVLDAYWKACEEEMDALRASPLDTVDEVVKILDAHDPHGPSVGAAFFSPSNAGESLSEPLTKAGWDIEWIDGDYHWRAHHPHTGQTLTYIEGDVYAE